MQPFDYKRAIREYRNLLNDWMAAYVLEHRLSDSEAARHFNVSPATIASILKSSGSLVGTSQAPQRKDSIRRKKTRNNDEALINALSDNPHLGLRTLSKLIGVSRTKLWSVRRKYAIQPTFGPGRPRTSRRP
jgi:hypothetical protein